MIERFEPAVRVEAGAALLADPVRGVRLEAARVLADVADAQFTAEQLRARDRATNEYVASLQQDADWPAGNVNLGNLRLRQGRTDEAVAAYERALTLDPRFSGAYVNLADAYRQLGRDAEGEKILRRGLAEAPRSADVHHALGLLLVRQGDKAAALMELRTAAQLAPDNARFAYVHAIGLHSAGSRAALAALREGEAQAPRRPRNPHGAGHHQPRGGHQDGAPVRTPDRRVRCPAIPRHGASLWSWSERTESLAPAARSDEPEVIACPPTSPHQPRG